jgi:UDP-N-acetylglucosamine 1-carboxyvinyltransferase
MSKFIIEGGYPLRGEFEVGGMKNAATPILAACLLTQEECTINNLPDIADVNKLIEIMRAMGAEVERGEHKVKVRAKNLSLNSLDKKAVQAMRSSILLLGPLLSRFHEVRTPQPGGCIIGNRPIDAHLYALGKLGAKISKVENDYCFRAEILKGTDITLPEFSVTATENAVMAACLASGRTIIKLAAAEPHVQDLCNFLNKMGAKISGQGTHTIIVDGVDKLSGCEHTLIPDQIEIGTIAVAAAATKGQVKIKNIVPEQLDIILVKLREIGVNFELGGNYLNILKTIGLKPFKLQAMPYPGFPTDLQAPFSILATQANGTSLIHDPLYEGRMSYIQELIKMGANAVICDPHRVLINGPTPLFGQEIKSYDLRAGATLIIAGLIAKGITEILQAEVVDRGYEKLEERLSALGAHIKRE